jgi:hypothetical protein
MERPSRNAVEKTAFLVSLTLFAFLYGFASSTRGWFPNDLIVTAWHQADAIIAPEEELPVFVWPRVYDWSGVRVAQPDAVAPGLTLISATWWEDGWRPQVRLIDVEGRVLHRWEIDAAELFSPSDSRTGGPLELHDLHGSYLLPDGSLVVNVEPVGTVRLDACGTVLWTLTTGSHHSISRTDDGSFWIPGVTAPLPPKSPAHPDGLPGITHPIRHDWLVLVSQDGVVRDSVHLLDLIYENGLERYLFKTGEHGDEDPTHLNDIEALSADIADEYPLFEAGDVVVSARDLNLVFVFDPDTRKVKWHASDPFIAQHDPDFTGDGWIGVFDNNKGLWNRGEVLGGSRIIALQPHTDSIRVQYPTERSDTFYTPIMGKWELLSNGNLLLTESIAGRVVEVAPDGSTVWEWVKQPFRDEYVIEVNEASRHDLTSADVESWNCADRESPAADV